MRFNIITLFPETISALSSFSILKRATEREIISIAAYNLRDFGLGKRKQVDDTPYGGGAGMVLRVDVLAKAIAKVREDDSKTKVILITPKGQRFSQPIAKELAKEESLALVCGHYEGFDERVRDLVDLELSLGDFVISGGELGAAIIVDAVARLVPGVLGNEESAGQESFENNLLEYPQYTKPEEFQGQKVPPVLLSGHHAEIVKWRKHQAEELTKKRRPDLKKLNT